MAKERMYGWNGEMPAKSASGQKAIVLSVMRANSDKMLTGHEWAELAGPQFKTRQDPYRVTLYYVLILKNEGCVKTNEYDINAVTKKEDVKHGVTVKTQATVEERGVVEEPATETVEAA